MAKARGTYSPRLLRSNDSLAESPGERAPEVDVLSRKRHWEQASRSEYLGSQMAWNEDGPGNIRTGSDVRKYYILAKDSSIRSAIDSVIAATFWSPLVIAPSPDNNVKAFPALEVVNNRLIEFAKSQIRFLQPQSLNEVLKDILKLGMICGFSVAEKVFEPSGLRWNLRGIKSKKSWDFNPVVDEFDNLTSIYHYNSAKYFNPEGFIFAVWPRIEGGSYFGSPFMESGMHEASILQKLSAQRAKNAALASLRILLHYYDSIGRSEDEIELVNSLIENTQSGGMVHIPSQIDQETGEIKKQDLLETWEDRTDTDAFKELGAIILETKRDLKRLFGVTDDLGQVSLAGGSYARAKVGFNMFLASVETAREWVLDTVNRQILPYMWKYNPGLLPIPEGVDYIPPQAQWFEIDEEVSEVQMNVLEKAINTGVIDRSEDWVRELLRFPAKK